MILFVTVLYNGLWPWGRKITSANHDAEREMLHLQARDGVVAGNNPDTGDGRKGREGRALQCDIRDIIAIEVALNEGMPPAQRRQTRSALSSPSSKLTSMVPPLRLGAKVMVSAPVVLLAAMIASRSETRPSVPGRSLMVPVPQGPSASNGGSAVSARVVTTMVLAAAGEARPPRARQQVIIRAVLPMSPDVSLHGNFLLIGKMVNTQGSVPSRRAS